MIKHIIITGGAGFIGSSLTKELLRTGHLVTCIDNFDLFYNRSVKENNIKDFRNVENYTLIEEDICNFELLKGELDGIYDVIVHIAAKAGVRPSIEDPVAYQFVNVIGTQNMLELASVLNIKQFVFASSSSVYGVNPNVPWKESDKSLMPISPYASSKLSCEMLGHVYSHLYGMRFLALRFFTVYGPRQRPDLAIHKFARRILLGKAIPVFGDGSTRRDYTFIDDIVQGIVSAIEYTESNFEIINIGNHKTISLSEMIGVIEEVFDKKAVINRMPIQPGDVPQTYADIDKAQRLLNYDPNTSFKEGIIEFKKWFYDSEEDIV